MTSPGRRTVEIRSLSASQLSQRLLLDLALCALLCCGSSCNGSDFGTQQSQHESSAMIGVAGASVDIARGSAGLSADAGGSASGSTAGGGAGTTGTSQNRGAGTASGSPTEGGTSLELPSPCGVLRADPGSRNVELCVPEGSFVMGSDTPNLGTGFADHTPSHAVVVSAFVLDAFEVTVGRYRQCVQAGRCSLPAVEVSSDCTFDIESDSSDALPVNCVTVAQAEEFCAWDQGRRLPTEAEWERVARGIGDRAYPWGATFTCTRAVAASRSICARAHKAPEVVGCYPAGDSVEGAHDMAGNVAEWVGDYAASYPTERVTNPQGPATGVTRIARGGSFLSVAPEVQVFVRLATTDGASAAIGIRCARSGAE